MILLLISINYFKWEICSPYLLHTNKNLRRKVFQKNTTPIVKVKPTEQKKCRDLILKVF